MKALSVILVFVCFLSLFLLCYGPALFQDRQFGFRDAGHFYYPLHQRVQEEWNQGRWPLWEPEENAGMPLLGNPAAAVLYPGKLVFAVLPYAWAARIYIVMHTALAFAAMLVLLRSWGISWSGSGLGALELHVRCADPVSVLQRDLSSRCGVAAAGDARGRPVGATGPSVGALGAGAGAGDASAGGRPAGCLSAGALGGRLRTGAGVEQGPCRHGPATRRRQRIARLAGPDPALSTFGLIAAVLLWAAATVALGVLLPKLREPHFGRPAPPLRWMPWMPRRRSTVAWGLAGVGFRSISITGAGGAGDSRWGPCGWAW